MGYYRDNASKGAFVDSRRTFVKKMTGVAGALAVSSTRIRGANDRIRLGMIGPGFRGLQLLWSLRDPNAEFVAFADAYSGRMGPAKEMAKAPAAKTFSDYRHLLDDASIDAVFIATPQHLHCRHFVDALGAGKHVYQEKALAFSVAHAKKMRAARLNAPQLTVQVGHQDCSSGQVADAQEILRTGYVGKITEIHSHFYRNTPHGKPQWVRPIPPDMTREHVDWKAFLGEAPDRDFDPHRFLNWRLFWDYSGGGFYELMSHQLCFWYKQLNLSVPAKVCSNGGVFLWKDGREVPDTVDALMVHSEDMMITWDMGFGNDQLAASDEVLGTDGTISRAEQIRYRPQRVNRREGAEILGHAIDRGQQHLDIAHVQNFLDSIRTGKQPNCPFELGFRVAMACRMAVNAYRSERAVRWDPVKEEMVS
jgi:predicted dehydrogenase